MPEPKKPQDHKKAASEGFDFPHGDKTFTLPRASLAVEKISGKAMRDAILGGQLGEAQLNFHMLEASGADQETIDAFYDRPGIRMMELLKEWMEADPDFDGVTVPQS